MVQNSIKDWVIGGLVLGLVFSVFAIAFIMVDSSGYDVDGINTSEFDNFADFDDYVQNTSSVTNTTYTETTQDKNIFDVLGGLVVDGLKLVKTFFASLGLIQTSISNIGESGYINIHPIFITFIVIAFAVTLASIFLFRFVMNREDEKR